MTEMMELMNKGIQIDFNQAKDCDCHTVAGILKHWLKQLPDPVLTYALYEECLKIDDSGNSSSGISHLRDSRQARVLLKGGCTRQEASIRQ